MQELHDYIENQEYNYMDSKLMEYAISLKTKVEELIKVEKEQILVAYQSALISENGSDYIGMNEEINSEIYFDKTYETKNN